MLSVHHKCTQKGSANVCLLVFASKCAMIAFGQEALRGPETLVCSSILSWPRKLGGEENGLPY